ncbi:MAG: DUF2865 domain-containing protein, partial [Xanthobacteraceae bacterium]
MKPGFPNFVKIGLVAGLVTAVLSPVAIRPAAAEGLFDFLFRRPFEDRRSYAPEVPPDRNSPQENGAPLAPGGRSLDGPRISGGVGTYTAYCVRLCDGRYFPVQPAHAGELCNSFCPASKTKIFSGTDVADARASDGTRYEELENAFVYREQMVDGCTCNGKDTIGLAKIDVNEDPTVRRGDMVATAEGPKKI